MVTCAVRMACKCVLVPGSFHSNAFGQEACACTNCGLCCVCVCVLQEDSSVTEKRAAVRDLYDKIKMAIDDVQYKQEKIKRKDHEGDNVSPSTAYWHCNMPMRETTFDTSVCAWQASSSTWPNPACADSNMQLGTYVRCLVCTVGCATAELVAYPCFNHTRVCLFVL